jgi:histidinol-phosphate aminotransferase
MPFFRPNIDAMTPYVPGEQPREGSKVIKLNTNENPYPCSDAVGRAVESVLKRGLQKYPDPLATAFRLRAGEVLGVPPEWILCGNGSDEILTLATRAFVGEGDLLRLPYPSYILYKTLAQIQGARSEEIRFNDRWNLGDDFTAATAGLKLAFLPNPNSPSGTMIAPEQVLELARRLPCPLLVDEAYVDFADDNCIRLVKESDKILVSRTLSKSYALAGLRFGFVVAQPHVIEGLKKLKDSYNCDAFSIAAATAAIDDQAWLKANTAKIRAGRTKLTDAVRKLGFTAVDSQANFVWCTMANRPLKPLYEHLKSNGVLVRYMPYAGWGEGLRISVGSDDQIDVCLSLLGEALRRGA